MSVASKKKRRRAGSSNSRDPPSEDKSSNDELRDLLGGTGTRQRKHVRSRREGKERKRRRSTHEITIEPKMITQPPQNIPTLLPNRSERGPAEKAPTIEPTV